MNVLKSALLQNEHSDNQKRRADQENAIIGETQRYSIGQPYVKGRTDKSAEDTRLRNNVIRYQRDH